MVNSKRYVLSYSYTDQSAYGLIGIYSTQREANRLLTLLQTHGDKSKEFKIDELDLEEPLGFSPRAFIDEQQAQGTPNCRPRTLQEYALDPIVGSKADHKVDPGI